MEDKINLLLTSYGLRTLLEEHDITEEAVITLLVDQGFIDLERYFEDE